MEKEFKDCPFCGNNKVTMFYNFSRQGVYFYYVKCQVCGGTGGTAGLSRDFQITEENEWNNEAFYKAKAKWNNRAEERQP